MRLELHPDVVVVALSGRNVFSLLNKLFSPGPARLLVGHESYRDGQQVRLPLVLQIESDRVHYRPRGEPPDRELPLSREFLRAVEKAREEELDKTREEELDTGRVESLPAPWVYFDPEGELGGLAADGAAVRLERTGPDRFLLWVGGLRVQLSVSAGEGGSAGSIRCSAWSIAVDGFFTDTLLRGEWAAALLAERPDEPLAE